MAVSHQGVFTQLPKITPVAFSNSDAANAKKTVNTAGSNGTKVTSVFAASTDTAARTAQLWLTRSAVSYLLGSTIVAALAGTDGALPSQNLLTALLMPLPVDNDGQPYLFLESGDTLQVSFTTQVTSTKEIDVVTQFGNF